MSTAAAQEWWQQGLFEWQREALQGRQELATLRRQRQALLQALQDLLAAVGAPDGSSASTIYAAQARRAAADAIEEVLGA
ncbi:hypothetical protein [Azohydromonas australica]|uniref:hypothetical protein n=1 Tax=Azohydromonas australica TaxID=364039 RepID=UPI000421C635|nr:hypothetical protein [Azohydromonas australica]